MSLDASLRRLATDRQPDPFFRRRLRSEVLNRWVATREGLAPVPERPWIGREMGRLGRACLYATVALGVSAASVLGVSQESVPGQPLYPAQLTTLALGGESGDAAVTIPAGGAVYPTSYQMIRPGAINVA